MSFFNLFHDLEKISPEVHLRSIINKEMMLYEINDPVYSVQNILPTESKANIYTTSTVRFLNFNAHSYQKYRDIDLSTVSSNTKDLFISNVFQQFISDIETKFSSSDAIRDVFMSSSFSVLICVLLSKDSYFHFKIVGGLFYSCSPCYGVLVPLISVNEKFSKKGIGSHLLRTIQKYTYLQLKTKRCLVWFTYDRSNTLLNFYRKLGFHPVIASNLPIEHSLPQSLISEINNLQVEEYLLESVEDIHTSSFVKHITIQYRKTFISKCEICGLTSNMTFTCQHPMTNSPYVVKTIGKKSEKRICGLQICATCNSQFGISPVERKCIFHSNELLPQINYTNIVQKQVSYFYPKKTKINKRINDVYNEIIKYASDNKKQFYNGYFESMNHCHVRDEIPCKHCFMKNNNINCTDFQQLLSSAITTEESDWNNLKLIVNNPYEPRNICQIIKLRCDKSWKCEISKDKKHNLFFDENIGRHSTLLQNSIFGLKNVYGFGDCGVFSILLPIFSGAPSLQDAIYQKILHFYQVNAVLKSEETLQLTKKDVLSIKGIRTVLFYAKMSSVNPLDIYDYVNATSEVIQRISSEIMSLREEENSNSPLMNKLLEQLRYQVSLTYENKVKDASGEEIYWLTNFDMMNLIRATDGMVGVLCVNESTVNIHQNEFKNIISDLGYYYTNKKHILKESKYFILIRLIDGKHYDFFYDRRNKCAIFPTIIDDSNSVMKQVLKFCSPTEYYYLTGIHNIDDEFGNESIKNYLEIPKFIDWKNTNTMDTKRCYRELKHIRWISDVTNKQNRTKIFPVIAFPSLFRREPSLQLLHYISRKQDDQLILLDHNMLLMDQYRIDQMCEKFKLKKFDLNGIEIIDIFHPPSDDDIILATQYASYLIFCMKVHNAKELYNDFYANHFGFDIFQLMNKEQYVKSVAFILSKRNKNKSIRKELYMFYIMMEKQLYEGKSYFDYHYADICNSDGGFEKWFYTLNTDFHMRYDLNFDVAEYHDEDHMATLNVQHPRYVLFDLQNIHEYWSNELAPIQKARIKLYRMTIKMLISEIHKGYFASKKGLHTYNSTKWLSFFELIDSTDDTRVGKLQSMKYKINGFNLCSLLMERNSTNFTCTMFCDEFNLSTNDLDILRDSLLYHCGYSKEKMLKVGLFDLKKLTLDKIYLSMKKSLSYKKSNDAKEKLIDRILENKHKSAHEILQIHEYDRSFLKPKHIDYIFRHTIRLIHPYHNSSIKEKAEKAFQIYRNAYESMETKMSTKKNRSISTTDEYFVENMLTKMKLLANELKFQGTQSLPYKLEQFHSNVNLPTLKQNSVFDYETAYTIKQANACHEYDNEISSMNLKHKKKHPVSYTDLCSLTSGSWINDTIMIHAYHFFEKQFCKSNRVKVIKPSFFALTKNQQYERLASNMFSFKYKKRYDDETKMMLSQIFNEHDIFLIPIHSENTHWYLIYINVKEKLIYVIDSKTKNEMKEKEKEKEVTLLIGLFCTIVQIYDIDCPFFTINQWLSNKTIVFPKFPQQIDGYNCGILVLMTMFQIMKHGSLVQLFRPENADAFRKYIYEALLCEHFQNNGNDHEIIHISHKMNETISIEQKADVTKDDEVNSVAIIDVQATEEDEYAQSYRNKDIDEDLSVQKIHIQKEHDISLNPFDTSSESDETISDITNPQDISLANKVCDDKKQFTNNKRMHAKKRRHILVKKNRGKNMEDYPTCVELKYDETVEELENILFDCSDLKNKYNRTEPINKGKEEGEIYSDSSSTESINEIVVAAKVRKEEDDDVASKVRKEEEDDVLRDEFQDEKKKFCLETTIRFFIIQLRMKYIMKVLKDKEELQQLKPNEDRNQRYLYFASHSSKVVREQEAWQEVFGQSWCQINCTFVNKWMSQKINVPRKRNKKRKFSHLTTQEKEVFQFIRTWKHKGEKTTYKWLKFTNAMRKQYQAHNQSDFRQILECFCPIQSVYYKYKDNKYYGEYLYQDRIIYYVELDELFFRRNTSLINKMIIAKQHPGRKILLQHGSVKCMHADHVNKMNSMQKEKLNYPRIQYQQGNHETCLERSMNSVIWYWLQNTIHQRNNKSNRNTNWIIGNFLNEIDRIQIKIQSHKKISKINTILSKQGAFFVERLPKKLKGKNNKKNQSVRDNEDINIFSETFDKGDFMLCQICGSDGNKNHTISITKNWIFDANFQYAWPLNKQNLDKCCSYLFETTIEKVSYTKCVLAYRYVYQGNDKQFIKK